jgi:transcriptional regulator with XRE-family HTH domain
LKEERARLGLNQPDFAMLAGTTKKTLIDWEADRTSPTAVQLEALAVAGADVLYILTGTRPDMALPPRQRALLANYEAADDAGRRVIEGTAHLAAQSSPSVHSKRA